jgi:hypothetical protein
MTCQDSLSPFQNLTLALQYLERHPGRFLFPIRSGAKSPPLISENLTKASNDRDQITAWSRQWPRCNWGLALKLSKLLVIDVDTKDGKHGQQTFDLLTAEYGLPQTEQIRTPSGGQHHYYAGAHMFALGERGLGRDVDCPNYVLIPGCRLAEGGEYTLVTAPGAPCAPAPEWVYNVIGKRYERPARDEAPAVELNQPHNILRTTEHLKNLLPAIEGEGGDDCTYRAAAWCHSDGAVTEDVCLELMAEHFNPRCSPPWEHDALATKVANAYRYAQATAGSGTAEAEFAADPPTPEDLLIPRRHSRKPLDGPEWEWLGAAPVESPTVFIDGVRVRIVQTRHPRNIVRRRAGK